MGKVARRTTASIVTIGTTDLGIERKETKGLKPAPFQRETAANRSTCPPRPEGIGIACSVIGARCTRRAGLDWRVVGGSRANRLASFVGLVRMSPSTCTETSLLAISEEQMPSTVTTIFAGKNKKVLTEKSKQSAAITYSSTTLFSQKNTVLATQTLYTAPNGWRAILSSGHLGIMYYSYQLTHR